MTKAELFKMLSDVPDDAIIGITHDSYNIIGSSTYTVDIKGFYENKGMYILSSMNVRPYKMESND